MRIGPESNMTESQEQEIGDHIRCVLEFLQLVQGMPEGEMPPEVNEAMKDAAEVCTDRVVMLCATLGQVARGEGPSEHEVIAQWMKRRPRGEA